MAKAIKRPAESWIYVLKGDRGLDEKQRSMFTLSPMTYAQRAAVRDDMARGVGDRVYRIAGEIVVAHVVSIENFPAGNPQPWPTDADARERYLELVDDDAVLEIGNEIWVRSSLGYREKPEHEPRDGDIIKNSFTPEGTSPSGASPTTTMSSTTAAPASAAPS